jgi:hypothetical protein
MLHFRRCRCLLLEAKHRVQPGCAAEVESMVGLEPCDSVATKDLVESMKECAQNFGLQQQNLDQSVKVYELRLCGTFLGWNASRSCRL